MNNSDRYFEITEVNDIEPVTIVEYPAVFGLWLFNQAENRKVFFADGCNWLIWTSFHRLPEISLKMACGMIALAKWVEVDLVGASNPISQRKKAMKGRKK